jgi:Aldo/keto reductase family
VEDDVTIVDRIASICANYEVALPVAALQYVLAHPDVTAVVIGAQSSTNVVQNAAYLHERVPQGLFDDLAASGLVAPIFEAAGELERYDTRFGDRGERRQHGTRWITFREGGSALPTRTNSSRRLSSSVATPP